MDMSVDPNDLELIGSTTWSDVLEHWRSREEEHWRPHYTERGFATWYDWRMQYMSRFAPDTRQWSLVRILRPEKVIPAFYVGAYRGWKQYYPENADTATFADIAKSPKLLQNETVQRVMHALPDHRQLIGARLGNDIVVRDGTHHCAAIALAVHEGRPVTGETVMAVMEFHKDEADLFLETYDQRFSPGTKKT